MTRRFLLAGLLAVLGALVPVSAHAAAPVARVDALTISGDRARFLFAGAGLPPDAELDPSSLRVTLDGRAASAQAEPPGAARPGGTAPGRSVMIVLDTSGSMGAAGLAAARQGAQRFLDRLPSDVAAGLALAGTRPGAQVVVRPTTDRAAPARAMRTLRPTGETDLYDGIAEAAAVLTGVDRRVVVLSDGADTGSATSLRAVRDRLTAARVTLDAVAFRTAEADDAALRVLTGATGGRLLKSADAGSLVQAFATAAGSYRQSMWVTVRLPSGRAGRALDLAATARAGTATLRATGKVRIAARPAATAPAAATTPAAATAVTSGALLLPMLSLVFLAIVAAVLVVPTVLAKRADVGVAGRIQRYRASDAPETGDDASSPVLRRALGLSERAVGTGDRAERMTRDLRRAGLALQPNEWLLVRVGLGLLVALVLALITGNVLLGVPLGAALAWFGTRMYLSSRTAKRLNAFADQLPDALQLIAGSLRSGFTVAQSMDRLAEQELDPLSGEISRAVAQTRLGVSVDEALEDVAERMSCRDLRWVVMAIRIQREVGGNLADVIEQTVQTMRERTHLRRHVRALSAEGRMSAYVLIALPIVVGFAMALIRPDYLEPLYKTPFGVFLLVLAIGLVCGGWVWMTRLVKVVA
ncbi:Bacterial type II secretion system protein F domain protein [Actinomadura rubteroloni]|uniref:Bacterial type II secretion system protein F domain protein n=1 Tax=Actinomadura rubteroloni TaxID=1926885 RepID=A0A2P4UPR6_9ACTN|nr:Bacterial type II secretion system protein F domain protein [Actinomadura rubteroloni]